MRDPGTVTHVYAFDQPHGLSHEDARRILGGKAANLSIMARDLGLPVPPGFTITTAACNAYLAGGWPEGLDEQLTAHMRRVEQVVGHRFGDAANPLLVSVRSGAPVSMPGMMDTILNLGLNDVTAAGLGTASGSPAFAGNCLARFRTMYRDIVGAEEVPEDPWLQLRGAIEAVFRSWNSARARTYRSREGIPDDLGTAVTVQAMVFGNRGADSGTGVLFTRNPATGEPAVYGDILFDAQGEDVVAGTHRTEPLAVLDQRLPAVAAELRDDAHRLERHFRDLCDIEFTIESGRLWMLQCRVGKRSPQAALRIAVDMAEDPDFPLARAEAVERTARILANPPTTAGRRDPGVTALTVGLPASPGVGTGEIAISPDAAVAVADAGRPVVLVRSETSPEDVHGMARAAAILTARGGLASHAAVVARGWGIPAVVGATGVELAADGAVIEGRHIPVGATITVDGGTGEVFADAVAGTATIVPEAATLLDWAREASIVIGETSAPAAAGAPSAAVPGAVSVSGGGAAPRPVTADDVVRSLLVKGMATPDAVGQATLADPATVAPLLDRLVTDGLAERAAGAYKLVRRGKLRGKELLAADQELCGAAAVTEALDAFLALNHEMKDLVTGWQMREVGGQQVMNDHGDAAYDAALLDRLATFHGAAMGWLAPLQSRLERFCVYRSRLDAAYARARDGDTRYVASPRVDSYHSAWFELHEDLILLAGRTRAEEVASGRA